MFWVTLQFQLLMLVLGWFAIIQQVDSLRVRCHENIEDSILILGKITY